MESVEGKVRYIINTSVASIEEHFQTQYISGFGKDCVTREVSVGWFALFNGSYEALNLGKEKPNLKRGDPIRIIVEKDNAEPSQPPIERLRQTTPVG
jgi:hypothetical protein